MSYKKIVLASNNSEKIREFQNLLTTYSIDLVKQADLAVDEIEETGLTFIENALLKARNACKKTKLPAIADDSGLVIHALNGRPGIYSARYAGANSTQQKRLDKILQEMQSFSGYQRRAQFVSIIVYLRHELDPLPIICQGIWSGEILSQPIGTNGFGYDPIFRPDDYTCSAAQLSSELKNQLSHRGQACQALIEALKKEL